MTNIYKEKIMTKKKKLDYALAIKKISWKKNSKFRTTVKRFIWKTL